MSTTLATTNDFHAFTYQRLDELRRAWRKLEEPPLGAAGLSTGEFHALVYGSGYEHSLKSPLHSFLRLDPWLQRWVMYGRGMDYLVGRALGEMASRARLAANDGAEDCSLRWLDDLRSAWAVADEKPERLNAVSSGEFAALAMACEHWTLLQHPILEFARLSGFLQRWLLERAGQGHLVGTKLGAENNFDDPCGAGLAAGLSGR